MRLQGKRECAPSASVKSLPSNACSGCSSSSATYIRAEDSEKVSAFDDMGLIDLIVARGVDAVDALPEGIRNDERAMAETIENNVRKLIIDEMAVNPKYYEKMSELLDALIRQRKEEALKYKDYLRQIVELARKVRTSSSRTDYPPNIISPARQALYDNLSDAECEAIAVGHAVADAGVRQKAVLALHDAIQAVKKADWRGNKFKEREVKAAISDLLGLAGTCERSRRDHFRAREASA